MAHFADYLSNEVRPEDVGLPPLNCGECGAAGIGSHPCPECGFDPS